MLTRAAAPGACPPCLWYCIILYHMNIPMFHNDVNNNIEQRLKKDLSKLLQMQIEHPMQVFKHQQSHKSAAKKKATQESSMFFMATKICTE
jgi:hypothetical protein